MNRIENNTSDLSRCEWVFALEKVRTTKKYLQERRDLRNKLPERVTQEEVDANSIIKTTEKIFQEASSVVNEDKRDEDNK